MGCERPGTLLCDECRGELARIDVQTACPACGAPFGEVLCTQCPKLRPEGGYAFSGARAFGSLEGTLARLVVVYKDSGERRLADELASLMLEACGSDWRAWAEVVCFVPASPEAYARRGFDHMERVASAFARSARLPLADVLYRASSLDQRALGLEGRAANASGAFEVEPCRARLVAGRRVLLLDDVFTTGATLQAAASALRDAGCCDIRVLVAARVW